MTLDEIKALIDAMAASDLAEMEVAKDGWTLRLVRRIHQARSAEVPASPPDPAAPAISASAAEALSPSPAPSPHPAAPDTGEVRAPLAGLAYLSPAPEAPPYVALGQAVEAGALLCTVEAMKTFHEVRAPRAGTVAALLVASGDEVEGGQPLLRLT